MKLFLFRLITFILLDCSNQELWIGKNVFCQNFNNSKLRSEDASYVKLAERLPKFKEVDGFPHLDISQINDGTGILETLRRNNALYHKSCYDNTNDVHLLRLQKLHERRSSTNDEPSSSRKRTKQNSVNYYVSFVVTKISKKIYALLESCIQVIEIVNASHVELLTESWKKMALKLGELDIYSKLCVRDLRANEVFYHKHHYVAFRNRCHASFVDKEEADEKRMNTVLECYALKQIIILHATVFGNLYGCH